MAFRTYILGAAAGGGLPQWNCGCPNCTAARRGEIPAQTQSSLAVTGDGVHWAILNASPDIRQQMAGAPPLHPTDLRALPLQSVLVTNGDIDHVAGLLTLREMQPFTLFATQTIHGVIRDNPMFDALNASVVRRDPIALDTPFDLAPGLTATLFAVPGKVPLYMEGETIETGLIGENTVGVELRAPGPDPGPDPSTDGDKRVYYIPGCACLNDDLRDRLRGADLLFFDGTLWADDEMIRAGLGQKTGARMGHMSMSGDAGSLHAFDGLDIASRVYVHMNNTNPVLRPTSPERATALAAGWTIGQDGLEITP